MTELFHLKFEISSSGNDLDMDCDGNTSEFNKKIGNKLLISSNNYIILRCIIYSVLLL